MSTAPANPHEEEALGKAYDSRLMKRLLRYMAPYKWWVVLALGLVAVVTPLELAPPFMFKNAIDRYFVPAMKGTLGEREAWRGILIISAIYFLVLLLIFWPSTRRSASCSALASKPCTTCGTEFLATCSACR
jgi:ABC-type multidrug transport system fused ATPase/permease subunit